MPDQIKACAFFNNKGGVGKTTQIANLGHQLGADSKVVVVDLDPQCNLTQHFLDDDTWMSVFERMDGSEDSTIWRFVNPITRRKPVNDKSRLELHESDNFNFKLVAGHPFLSRLDDALAIEWTHFLIGTEGSVVATYWLKLLLEQIRVQAPDTEYVLFDLGPSLSPMNRSVLISCDFFVAPVSPDLFSLYSFANIDHWFQSIKTNLSSAREHAKKDEGFSRELMEYLDRGVSLKFIGYISQQYITRSKAGERRQIRAFQAFVEEMPKQAEHVVQTLDGSKEKIGGNGELLLGNMPHMYSMVALSHSAHAPIESIGNRWLAGAQFSQREKYTTDMQVLVDELRARMEGE